MNSTITVGLSDTPVIRFDTNSIPPIKLNTPTSAEAPMPIQTIIPTVANVRLAAPIIRSKVNSPRIIVESVTPITPTAEASVTLAMPP